MQSPDRVARLALIKRCARRIHALETGDIDAQIEGELDIELRARKYSAASLFLRPSVGIVAGGGRPFWRGRW
jgi:hypothetical protein